MMNGEPFFWIRKDGAIAIGRGEIDNADLILAGTPSQIAAYIYVGAPLESIGAEGDLGLARRLPYLFPMPDKAPAAA
jgi:hypothetical protein